MLCGDPYFCLMVKSPILGGKPDLYRWLPLTLPHGSVKASSAKEKRVSGALRKSRLKTARAAMYDRAQNLYTGDESRD